MKCIHSASNFILFAAENKNYKIVIDEAVLYIRIVKLKEALRLAIESSLEKTPAKYPVKQVETSIFTFPENSVELTETSLCEGKLPTRICLALTPTKAFNGSIKSDPFYLGNFKIRQVRFKVNDRLIPASDGIKTDPADKAVVQAYIDVYLGTENFLRNSILLDYVHFTENSYLMLFNLTGDPENGRFWRIDRPYFLPVKRGKISLNIELDEPLEDSVTLVVLYEHEVEMRVDAKKKAIGSSKKE